MSFGAFAFIYFSLAFILFVLILFEKKFIAMEDKYKKARKLRIKELEEENSLQKEIIYIQFKKNVNLKEKNVNLNAKLNAQKRINSTILEDLRQERMKRDNEVQKQIKKESASDVKNSFDV